MTFLAVILMGSVALEAFDFEVLLVFFGGGEHFKGFILAVAKFD